MKLLSGMFRSQEQEKIQATKVQREDPDPICSKKLCNFENEAEGQSEFDDEAGIATELDSSNRQESSCMSSVLDEVSIGASSFQQL